MTDHLILNKRFCFRSAFALSTCLLAGCATKPPESPPAPPPRAAAARPAPSPAPVVSSILPGSAKDFQVNVGDTVHFAYNKYEVMDGDKPLLQRQATWLNKYRSVHVTIEGYCDERGTREYNLALGARRANAVMDYLVAQGVATARVDTISYGKERPLCTASTEDCWAQNRRGLTAIGVGASS